MELKALQLTNKVPKKSNVTLIQDKHQQHFICSTKVVPEHAVSIQ